MKNTTTENIAAELMFDAGFSLQGITWAKSINSPTWAYYMTLAANKEAVCV